MKMKRVFAAMLAVAAMAFAMTACVEEGDTEAAITNTENVEFTATPSQEKIIVKMKKGGKQKLDLLISKDLYDPTLLQVADYNFDGYQDIAFPSNYNEKNTIYQLWLYDTESGKFVEMEGFGQHYNPTLDAEKKQINTVSYTDPVTTATSVLEWREGALVCMNMKTETQDGNGHILKTEFAYNEETKQLELVMNESIEIEGFEELTDTEKE